MDLVFYNNKNNKAYSIPQAKETYNTFKYNNKMN